MKNKNILVSLSLITSKSMEVISLVFSLASVILFICTFYAQDFISNIVLANGSELSCYGFSINAVSGGVVHMGAVRAFSVGAFLILLLFTMVFRNAYLIVKTANGKTWFSKGPTPFQKDIVRMLREIGIFLIAVTVVGLNLSIIARLFIGPEIAEISMRLDGVVLGLLALCLSTFFSYGTQLQDDVDGLL